MPREDCTRLSWEAMVPAGLKKMDAFAFVMLVSAAQQRRVASRERQGGSINQQCKVSGEK